MTALPTTGAIAQWFGSNRMLGEHVGRELSGCSWVGVPFAGGMCELQHITARTLAVNDLHRHIVNLASVAADPKLGPALIRRLRRLPLHPEVLDAAQERCKRRERERGIMGQEILEAISLDWAVDYFTASWMARSGQAGTKGEFNGGLCMRWEAGGGDSAVRFRSATTSLIAWRRILSRATFTCIDAFDFLAKCQDKPGHGIYSDPPFPGPGDAYKHTIDADGQRELARYHGRFTLARVVIRYYDVPLVRELYPADRWRWVELKGRKATNADAPEVLLIGGGA